MISSLLRAHLVVGGVLWAALAALYAFGFGGRAPVTFSTVMVVLGSSAVGATLGLCAVAFRRSQREYVFRRELGPKAFRGVKTSFGSVPVAAALKPESEHRRRPEVVFQEVEAHVRLVMPDFPPRFFELHILEAALSQAHVHVLIDILEILLAQRNFPAGYFALGMPKENRPHGDRTLLQHSALVCLNAVQTAPHFEYEGDTWMAKGKKYFRLKLDPNGPLKFSPLDPLIVLMALAHDIGKLDTFILAPTNGDMPLQAIDNWGDHDVASARRIGGLASLHDLPLTDQECLLVGVSRYHALHALPAVVAAEQPDDRKYRGERLFLARNNRLHWLTQLLAKADKLAGAMEYGCGRARDAALKLVEEDTVAEIRGDEFFSDLTKTKILKAFYDVIGRQANIGFGVEKGDRLGFKATLDGHPVLILRTDLLEGHMTHEMGIASPELVSGTVSRLTKSLLSVLEEKGFLYKQVQNQSSARLVYRVGFTGQVYDKAGRLKNGSVEWKMALIVLCEAYPSYASREDFRLVPTNVAPIWNDTTNPQAGDTATADQFDPESGNLTTAGLDSDATDVVLTEAGAVNQFNEVRDLTVPESRIRAAHVQTHALRVNTAALVKRDVEHWRASDPAALPKDGIIEHDRVVLSIAVLQEIVSSDCGAGLSDLVQHLETVKDFEGLSLCFMKDGLIAPGPRDTDSIASISVPLANAEKKKRIRRDELADFQL